MLRIKFCVEREKERCEVGGVRGCVVIIYNNNNYKTIVPINWARRNSDRNIGSDCC